MLSYHAEVVMADATQLRKCQELLGKLPERPLPRARNPVWVFLRGIEGFDIERASECLVKLLDKRYDTVEVLKLATKWDLVEDAGILPEDALRIVGAAKHYVAPQDIEPTLEDEASKPEVASQGIGIKEVNLGAVPKQETVKDSKATSKHIKDALAVGYSKLPDQTYSIPEGMTYPHTCG